jgi:exodeoxyribonuclease-5
MKNIIDYSQSKELAIKHQKQILNEATDYLKSGGRELVISGAAGTGKSYLTRHLLENYVRNGQTILICALSHQAVGVANNFMRGSRLKFKSATLASALSARKVIQPDGKVEFVVSERYHYVNGVKRIKKPPIAEADIIIIDECSQLSEKYLAMIDSVKKHDAIVIYLGDVCQLPPPERGEGEIYSPVFKKEKIYELIYPFRYEGEIAEFGHYIRSEILKGLNGEAFNPRCWLDITDQQNKDIIFYDDKRLFADKMIETFKEDNQFTKYISYTRANYTRTGEYIRNKLNPQKQPYEKGDYIICKNNYYGKDGILKLQNGQETCIQGKRMLTGYIIWINDRDGKKFFHFVEHSKTSAKKLASYYSNLLNISKDDFVIDELEYWSHDFDNKIKFIPTKPKNEKKYAEFIESLKSSAVHPMSVFNNNWEVKNAMDEFFCDIKYAYSMTSHTSQGSTYSNIFVNTDDIFGVRFTNDLEKLQSFYVAITRATKSVSILYS